MKDNTLLPNLDNGRLCVRLRVFMSGTHICMHAKDICIYVYMYKGVYIHICMYIFIYIYI